jgi:hypothetical protein
MDPHKRKLSEFRSGEFGGQMIEASQPICIPRKGLFNKLSTWCEKCGGGGIMLKPRALTNIMEYILQ